MAAVGLDIPTLNTIIFASPRSEVTAFGRILRKINKELPPKGMILLIIPFKYIAGSLIIEEESIKEINMLIMF